MQTSNSVGYAVQLRMLTMAGACFHEVFAFRKIETAFDVITKHTKPEQDHRQTAQRYTAVDLREIISIGFDACKTVARYESSRVPRNIASIGRLHSNYGPIIKRNARI